MSDEIENIKPVRKELQEGPRIDNALKQTIMSKFNEVMGTGTEPVRELFSLEDIRGRTLITSEQRMLITQLHFIRREFDIPMIDEFITDYSDYGISVDGLSRKQFVEVHRTQMPSYMGEKNDDLPSAASSKNRKLE